MEKMIFPFLVVILMMCILDCVAFELEASDNPDVIFGDEINNLRQIFMNETDKTYSEIFVVTGANAEPSATLLQGDSQYFQFTFRYEDTDEKYVGVLLNPIDFEILSLKYFLLEVTVEGSSSSKGVIINVENIPDEKPEVSVPIVCRMKENRYISKDNTSCILTVSNTEGNMDGYSFSILSNQTFEKGLFELEWITEPNPNDKKGDVALFLKDSTNTLDAGAQNYKFDFQILKDSTPLPLKNCLWTNLPVIILIVPEIDHCPAIRN